MRVERVYLGTWSQRTNLHLQEVYRFFKYGAGVDNLDDAKVKALHEALRVSDVSFHNAAINSISVACGAFTVSVTEDGVVLISMEETDLAKASASLRKFHDELYEPAMRYLFSRGAPMPKEMADIARGGDFYAFVREGEEAETREAFEIFGDRYHSHSSTEGVRVMEGHKLGLVDIGDMPLAGQELEGVARDLIFFKEFERQLYAYVRIHRVMWDELAGIRDASKLKYRNFPAVRADILRTKMTLDVVRARLSQMDDILSERRGGEPKGVTRLLADLGMLDFGSLHASRRYVSHLWEMTDDFAEDTLTLLETLYQENTQRELNALKFITLITAVTSFFGMNIAFPWEDRWAERSASSYEVVILVAIIAVSVYYLLRALILNRKFVLTEEKAAKDPGGR